MPRQTDIRDYASRAEGALRTRGTYLMPNDEPGLARAVYEKLRGMYPNADLSFDNSRVGGEAEFRSKDHLGFKA